MTRWYVCGQLESAPTFGGSCNNNCLVVDVHGFGPDTQVEKFKKDFAVHIRFRDGGVYHDGSEYDHLKRFRKKPNGVTTIESNPKCLDAVLGWKAQRTCPRQAFLRTRKSS